MRSATALCLSKLDQWAYLKSIWLRIVNLGRQKQSGVSEFWCIDFGFVVSCSLQLPHSKKVPGLIGPFYFVPGRVFPG